MQALPFLAIGLKAGGSILQGVAGYRQGQMANKIAKANARTADAEGVAQAARIRDLSRIQLGRQVGAQAESGFELGTGTAIDSLIESATEAELEALDAQRQARTRASAYRMQGQVQKLEGKYALMSGIVGAASAVASGGQDYATAAAGAGG